MGSHILAAGKKFFYAHVHQILVVLLVVCLMAGPQFTPHQPEKSNFFLRRAGIPFPSLGGFYPQLQELQLFCFSHPDLGLAMSFCCGSQGRRRNQSWIPGQEFIPVLSVQGCGNASGCSELPSWLFFYLYSPQRCRKKGFEGNKSSFFRGFQKKKSQEGLGWAWSRRKGQKNPTKSTFSSFLFPSFLPSWQPETQQVLVKRS